MHRNNYKFIGLVFVTLILLGFVFWLGMRFGYNRKPEIEKVVSVINKEIPANNDLTDFNPFWKAWNILSEKSIYASDTKNEDKVWGAISGLASAFDDPYTVFFNPEENKLFNEEIEGVFSGIGAEVGMKDKILTIIAPLKDTPAWKSGLKSGDKILQIDDKDTTNMTIDEALGFIRGDKDTIVKLIILRPGEKTTREFKIMRDNIEIPILDTEKRDDGIFVISFYSFTEDSEEAFRDALLEFMQTKYHKLIIDLRGNPGGYLGSAVQIASWFIDEGKIIVSEDFGDNGKKNSHRSYGPKLFDENLDLVVLVDGGSASASEILAGALKDHGVATLVGEQTFGKGSVQELVEITENTSLKITVANWLTPNGQSISQKGITPDVKVVMTLKDFENKKDPQMDKAVEILKAKN